MNMNRGGVFVWVAVLVSMFLDCWSETVEVQTQIGRVEGSVEAVAFYDENSAPIDTIYVQYLGIPYAEPPIGELRFKKPVPKRAWLGTHNGTYYRNVCYQGVEPGPIAMKNAIESEDCLSLDIYAPNGTRTNGSSYAVLVFMHVPSGGSNGYIGDVLSVYGDIIVVVINYRVEFLGFYGSGDNVARGNYGLWDQHLAIKWVSDNIASFNGDPARVTVAGYSTGAQYALLQAMYPGNQGLISNAIAHSGILVPTYKTTPYDNTGVETAVEALDCKKETSAATLACLRSKSLADLSTSLYNLPLTFTPVIDGDFIREDPQTVLVSRDPATKDVRDMFASVNLLTGIDNMEGAMHVVRMWAPLLDQQVETFRINRTSFSDVVVKTALDLVFGANISRAIVDTVAFQYSDLLDPSNSDTIRGNTVKLSTDIDAAVPAMKTANLHSKLNASSATYFFQFSTKLTMDTILTPSWLDGANLGEEIYFLFGFSQRNMNSWTQTEGFIPTEAERNVSKKMMTLWTNFVKTGNPMTSTKIDELTEWPEYTEMVSSYIDITSEGLFSRMYFREPYVTFWTKIVPSLIELGTTTTSIVDTVETTTNRRLSGRFNIDSVTSDNIIIALVTISGSIFIAFILVCSLAIFRGSYEKYVVKKV